MVRANAHTCMHNVLTYILTKFFGAPWHSRLVATTRNKFHEMMGIGIMPIEL